MTPVVLDVVVASSRLLARVTSCALLMVSAAVLLVASATLFAAGKYMPLVGIVELVGMNDAAVAVLVTASVLDNVVAPVTPSVLDKVAAPLMVVALERVIAPLPFGVMVIPISVSAPALPMTTAEPVADGVKAK